VLVGAAGTGAALALWAIVRLIVRTAFVAHAQWIDVLCALAILLGCVFLGTCWYLDIRWLLCAVCLFGMLFLQNQELDQQALHQHGRTEHVRVRQIRWSAGDGMNPGVHFYTVTVDPQGIAPLRRGDKPGPPVIQQFLQIPLGPGLAFTLWRPAGLLLHRQRVPSAGPTQP
jgi:hypothetical protein